MTDEADNRQVGSPCKSRPCDFSADSLAAFEEPPPPSFVFAARIGAAPLTPGCNRAYQRSNSVSTDALLFVPLAIRPEQRTSSGALMGVVNSDTDI